MSAESPPQTPSDTAEVQAVASGDGSLARLLAALGRPADERLSLNHEGREKTFKSVVTTVAKAPALAVDPRNYWYGAAPLRDGVRGRGTEADTIGIRELCCDLDLKPGGFKSDDDAWACIAALSALLGAEPVAVVHSGHGFQPHWRIDGWSWPQGDREALLEAKGLMTRWQRLVGREAERFGAKVDSTFDLARVWRAPGTVNFKNPDAPVKVRVRWGSDDGLTMHDLANVLDKEGIEVVMAAFVDGGNYRGPAHADLEPWQREQAEAEVARVVDGWKRRLATAVGWAEGTRDEHDRGWEMLCRDAAWTLACLEASAWSGADGEALYDEVVPDELAAAVPSKWYADLVGKAVCSDPPWAALDRFPAPSGEDSGVALERCRQTFIKWLGGHFELASMYSQLAVMAVERMDGDPLWLMLISGSGNAKTETVTALAGGGAIVISTITGPAGLLSASPHKEKSKFATGGLLVKIGRRGVLVIKDFTSILSMPRDSRGEVLGALREVYDGKWDRNVGTDGGLTLVWEGRLGLVAAVTTAWDTHHSVIATMGDRFVVIRTDSTVGRQETGRQAARNIGAEPEMRAELAQAVEDVLAAMDREPVALTDEEQDRLLQAADLVTLARTAVDCDYKGTPLMAHGAEMPTRFMKQLVQIVRGAVAVGLDREEAMALAVRCARDSVPPMRLMLIDYLAKWSVVGDYRPMHEIRKGVNKPRTTVDQTLQALHLLGLVEATEEETTYRGREATRWSYRLNWKRVDPDALLY